MGRLVGTQVDVLVGTTWTQLGDLVGALSVDMQLGALVGTQLGALVGTQLLKSFGLDLWNVLTCA